jgi:hypothetical protein
MLAVLEITVDVKAVITRTKGDAHHSGALAH